MRPARAHENTIRPRPPLAARPSSRRARSERVSVAISAPSKPRLEGSAESAAARIRRDTRYVWSPPNRRGLPAVKAAACDAKRNADSGGRAHDGTYVTSRERPTVVAVDLRQAIDSRHAGALTRGCRTASSPQPRSRKLLDEPSCGSPSTRHRPAAAYLHRRADRCVEGRRRARITAWAPPYLPPLLRHPTCSKMGATSAPCKSCSATRREHHDDLHASHLPRPGRCHESRGPHPRPMTNRTPPGRKGRMNPMTIFGLGNSRRQDPGPPTKSFDRTMSVSAPAAKCYLRTRSVTGYELGIGTRAPRGPRLTIAEQRPGCPGWTCRRLRRVSG